MSSDIDYDKQLKDINEKITTLEGIIKNGGVDDSVEAKNNIEKMIKDLEVQRTITTLFSQKNEKIIEITEKIEGVNKKIEAMKDFSGSGELIKNYEIEKTALEIQLKEVAASYSEKNTNPLIPTPKQEKFTKQWGSVLDAKANEEEKILALKGKIEAAAQQVQISRTTNNSAGERLQALSLAENAIKTLKTEIDQLKDSQTKIELSNNLTLLEQKLPKRQSTRQSQAARRETLDAQFDTAIKAAEAQNNTQQISEPKQTASVSNTITPQFTTPEIETKPESVSKFSIRKIVEPILNTVRSFLTGQLDKAKKQVDLIGSHRNNQGKNMVASLGITNEDAKKTLQNNKEKNSNDFSQPPARPSNADQIPLEKKENLATWKHVSVQSQEKNKLPESPKTGMHPKP